MTAPVVEVASRHYRNALRISRAAVATARRQWRRLPPGNVEESFARQVGPELYAAVLLAQLAAAEESDSYVDAVLAALHGPAFVDAMDLAGRIIPDGFADGFASDGRPLESLLVQPVIAARAAQASGMSWPEASAVGETMLDRIVNTQTADAGRAADSVAMVARPAVVGYVRMLTPPSCPRCVVLAGRFYRWNEGFERHPNCDCRHIPATEDAPGDARTDPRAAVLAGHVRGLSKADRRAIEDGADVGQVINAHRGMYLADGRKFTTEGTTRRGFAATMFRSQTGRRLRQRLRPEQIYTEANGDRAEALRLLNLHGYIV